LEALSSASGFWDDQAKAQEVMQRLSVLREPVDLWRGIETRVRDASELLGLAVDDVDDTLISEIRHDADEIAADLARLEFGLMFSGPYDRSDAILAIHAGAGGTDSQDWVAMLLRMYLRWAEAHGLKAEVLDSLAGDEAGLKRAMVGIQGTHAYGRLRSERGVHRLVRLSPFDASHRRHTSFAMVELWPDIQSDIRIEIKPEELEIETFSSSGPGGQHMQKNATAVRITHKPSGLVVSCQGERSQTQNRETALKVLRGRLYEQELVRQEQELSRLKGKHIEAGWGNQIRSYVLHPYKMVKDLRTSYEVGNPEAVLDGDLDGFMEAYLREWVGEPAN
jgi:peptide chain release factor 2